MHVRVAFIQKKNAEYKAIKGRFDKATDSGWWCIESRSPVPSLSFSVMRSGHRQSGVTAVGIYRCSQPARMRSIWKPTPAQPRIRSESFGFGSWRAETAAVSFD